MRPTVAALVDQVGWDATKQCPEARVLLQRMGTEASRDIHCPHLRTALAERNILRMAAWQRPLRVVSDVRFAYGAEGLRSLGGLVVGIRRQDVENILYDTAAPTGAHQPWGGRPDASVA